MTQAYDNTNSGLLTKNDKGDNPSRPDYKGSINVDGVDYWLSAWVKEGRAGTKLEGQRYMSLSVKPKDAQYTPAPAPAPVAAPAPRPNPRGYTMPPAAPGEPPLRALAPLPKTKTGTGFDDIDDDIPF